MAVSNQITAVKNQLDVGKWRRKCSWLLANIDGIAERLKKRLPGNKHFVLSFLEPLDCYANLVFKSPEERSSASIDKMFARREAERDKYNYY